MNKRIKKKKTRQQIIKSVEALGPHDGVTWMRYKSGLMVVKMWDCYAEVEASNDLLPEVAVRGKLVTMK